MPDYLLKRPLRFMVVLTWMLGVLTAVIGWRSLDGVEQKMVQLHLDEHRKIFILDAMENRVNTLHIWLHMAAAGLSQSAIQNYPVPALMQQINALWQSYWQMNQRPVEWDLAKAVDQQYRICVQGGRLIWAALGSPADKNMATGLFYGVDANCHQTILTLNRLSEVNHQQILMDEQRLQHRMQQYQMLMLLALLLFVMGGAVALWLLRYWVRRMQFLHQWTQLLVRGGAVEPLPDTHSDEISQIVEQLIKVHQRFSRLITQLRRKQQMSLRLSHRHALHSGLNRLLFQTGQPEVLLQSFAQMMIDTRDFDFVWFGSYREQVLITMGRAAAFRTNPQNWSLAMDRWLCIYAERILPDDSSTLVLSLSELMPPQALAEWCAVSGCELLKCASFALEMNNESIRWVVLTHDAEVLDAQQLVVCEEMAADIGSAFRVFRDRQEQMNTQKQLRQHEALLQQVQRAAQLGFWHQISGSQQLHLSEEACFLLRVSPQYPDFSLGALITHIHPADRGRVQQFWLQPSKADRSESVEFRVQIPLGEDDCWLLLTQHEGAQEDDEPLFLGTLQNTTERRQREEELRLFSLAMDQSASTVVITDLSMQIIYANPSFERTTGYSCQEALGKTPHLLKSGKTPDSVYQELYSRLKENKSWRGVFINRRKDGSHYMEQAQISPVRQADGRLTHYIAVKEDITEQHKIEEQYLQLANLDVMTDLPNRRWFMQHLEELVRIVPQSFSSISLIFLDLNRFKEINDTRGYVIGDCVLKDLAHRLKEAVVEPHILARVGGDEFVVLLKNVDRPQQIQWAEQLLRLIQAPQVVDGVRYELKVNMGIAQLPEDAHSAQQLLRYADIALFQAKTEDLPWQYFQPAMEAVFVRRSEIFRRLSQAFEEKRLQVYYQPQLRLADGVLMGAEALLRWNDPELGWISPAEFIPVAEERGLIDEIGLWVLRQVCRQVHSWVSHGLMFSGRIAVNVSPHQLNQVDIGVQLTEVLHQEGVDVRYIELEITESAAMVHPERSIAIINQWVQQGFSVAIDDFGTGYSSLVNLKRYQAGILKIDQCFIRQLLEDANDHAIVEATIAIARSLSMHTLAEGVETQAQAQELLRMRCDYVQGFLYDRALPADMFQQRYLLRQPVA